MKKYMSNIRVWRRLGIVLSVLWFVGFADWVWVDTNHHNYDFLGVQLAACQATLPSSIFESVDACKKEATEVFYILQKNARADFWMVILLDLASIALVWLIGYVIVLTGRWVKAGATI
jgi:preprotein translocase subunit Sss1